MFVGKDKDGRYEFLDTGEMIMSKDLLIRSDITIEKEFNREDSEKIHKITYCFDSDCGRSNRKYD